MPRISVVLPTFNCESYVGAAVESVLGQSFGDFELLLLDDGSTDGTFAQLESYRDPRIRLFRNERNLGLIENLNKGLREAKGEYIARMDGDDICLPERFGRQIAFLDSHPQVGILGTSVRLIDGNGSEMGGRDYHGSDTLMRWRLLFGNPLAHPSVMFRRSLLAKTGGYDPGAIYCEDYDLWVKMAPLAGLHCLEDRLLKYRIHPGGVSQQKAGAMAEGASRVALKARRELLGWQGGGPGSDEAGDTLEIYQKFRRSFSPSIEEEALMRGDFLRRVAHKERWRSLLWAQREKYFFPMAGELGKMILTKLSRRA